MIELAAFQGNLEYAQCLLRLGAKMNEWNDSQWPAWKHAIADGHFKVVELFLNHGLSANATDSIGCSTLETAVWNGHAEIVELLLKKGAIMTPCRENSSRTLLQLARRQHPTNTRLIEVLENAEQSERASQRRLLAGQEQHVEFM